MRTALLRRRRRGPSLPADLVALLGQDPSDLAPLFPPYTYQDPAATIPAILGDPVGGVRGVDGQVIAVCPDDSARGVVTVGEGGLLGVLMGTDDYLLMVGFQYATQPFTSIAKLRRTTNSTGVLLGWSTVDEPNGGHNFIQVVGGTNAIGRVAGTISGSTATLSNGETAVLSIRSQGAGGTYTYHKNGVAIRSDPVGTIVPDSTSPAIIGGRYDPVIGGVSPTSSPAAGWFRFWAGWDRLLTEQEQLDAISGALS